jgi:methylglutaconyl-CoA hydratase
MRVLVIEGTGEHFCAGADLNYMKQQAQSGEPQSLRDARVLATLFYRLASFPTTVIAAVRGSAIGGGFGLVCCADVVVCEAQSFFATSEVRLGIVPGVISPYIVRKLGAGRAAPFMLSGERLSAVQAMQLGLVTVIVDTDENKERNDPDSMNGKIRSQKIFQAKLTAVVNEHLKAGPNAARRTKELLRKIHPLPDPGLFEFTATSIAMARCSSEGQHGLERFFAKQSPAWTAELPPDAFGVPQ